MLSFSKTKDKLVITQILQIELLSGTILHGASNEPEVYLESSQTSMRSVLAKTVNGHQLLTIIT